MSHTGTNTLAIDGGKPAITTSLPSIKNASGRQIGREEIEEVTKVLESGTLSFLYGSRVKTFERMFAEKFNIEHAVAVSSGTAALHTAMVYLNPEPGDEVIMSPISDMGSVIPILLQLAVPVFVDIDPTLQNIDPALIEEKITDRTKAIIVTHIHGNPADMDPIMEIAKKHGIFVIEDCAQAHMATYKGRLVGTIGDMGCFSLQQSKHITTGEGGMVISRRNNQFGRDVRLCMDKGWQRSQHDRDHLFLAPAYHMTELQAAVGIAQISKYEMAIEKRREAGAMLNARLDEFDFVTRIPGRPDSLNTYFQYCFRIDPDRFSMDVGHIVEALNAEGLYSWQGYPGPIPLYLYPVVKDHLTFGTSGYPFTLDDRTKSHVYAPGLCPKAEKACQETIVLPWSEGMGKAEVDLIAHALEKVFNAYLT